MKIGRTILISAVGSGHFHIVRMLCNEFKVDVNMKSFLGNASPLHIAVENNFRQIASFLISFGAEVNSLDYLGCTPLHRLKSFRLLKLLLKFKVDPFIKSNEGLTPLGHYLNYTPRNDQMRSIIDLLTSLEDTHAVEEGREILRLELDVKRKEIDRLALIVSSNSTIKSLDTTKRSDKFLKLKNEMK
jgi:ankyrin repeat protein